MADRSMRRLVSTTVAGPLIRPQQGPSGFGKASWAPESATSG